MGRAYHGRTTLLGTPITQSKETDMFALAMIAGVVCWLIKWGPPGDTAWPQWLWMFLGFHLLIDGVTWRPKGLWRRPPA